MYTLFLLFILATMTAFMLLVFCVWLAAILRILGGFTSAPSTEPPSNPAGPSWTVKYKEDRKTQTIVLPGNDEKEVLKLVLHMGIRYDRIVSMTKNI